MKKINKMIPSKLETGFQKWVYRFAPYLPESITPNKLTAIGALGGMLTVIAFLLANISKWAYLAGIVGIITHIVTDDLDGYVARTKQMTSEAGAYFDIIVDVCLSTFVLIALGISRFANIYVVIWLVPMYAVTIVTLMNYILYLREFPFPRFGPIESQIGYIIIAVMGMIFDGRQIVSVGNVSFTIVDILILIGIPFIYYETFRMQIQLFIRLRKKKIDGNEDKE